MNENENLVSNVDTEKAENTAEEMPKIEKSYSQEDVDKIVSKAKARTKAKITKEYDRKYGGLVDTLKAGTGKESVEEITDEFRGYYEDRGIKIDKKPSEFSERDINVLAKADAEEIIRGGYEEVAEETERLSLMKQEEMTARDKAVYELLREHKKNADRGMELSKMGVSETVWNSPEFISFAKKFNSDTPITDIYDIYSKTQKKEIKTMGSMKNSHSEDNGVKDFYSYEEAMRFTKKDLDQNPALFAAVERSMSRW